MPDYSEYIIIENKKMEFYNHYRGNYTFMCDMFWGKKDSLEIIQNQSKIEKSKFDNADSRIIIDKSKKELFLQLSIFEYENGVGILINEVYLDLLRVRWKGWKVNYMENGYEDFMRIIIEHNYFEDKEYMLERINQNMHNYEKKIRNEPSGTLVSLFQNSKIKFGVIEKNIVDVITMGDDVLNIKLENNLPNDKLPFGGIHIDKNNQKVNIWYSFPSPKLGKWSKRYWKNWHLEYRYNGYEFQYNKCNKKTTLEETKEKLRKEAIDFLRIEIVECEREPFVKIEKEKRITDFRQRRIPKNKRLEIFEDTIKKYKKNYDNK